MSSFPPPEGDGVVDSIYHYLWTKNTQLETCPNVVIPNTVVYKYRQPAYWYYSSSDQQLKMKKKGDMTNQKISDSFAKRKNPSCEVVAYYISTRETEAGIETTTMEYFDEEGLKDFLFSRQKEHNGIIQKFIDPKGKSNAIIRAIWSPKLCLLEQRVTLKPINDGRYDLYQRCVTYEGAEHQSMNAPVRGVYLPSRLQTICDSIVDHCMRTSSQHYRISRMVLNFKLDHNNKLWLLWCSSMRLAADKFALKKPFPVNISGDITVPDKFKDAVFRSANLPSTFFKEKYFICPGSGEIVDSSDSFEISYKTMIASHEEDRRQKARHHAVEARLKELDTARTPTPTFSLPPASRPSSRLSASRPASVGSASAAPKSPAKSPVGSRPASGTSQPAAAESPPVLSRPASGAGSASAGGSRPSSRPVTDAPLIDPNSNTREVRSASAMSGRSMSGRMSMTSLSNKSGRQSRGAASVGSRPDININEVVIPPLLKVIDKELTVERYTRLLGSAEFLARKLRVSYPTYMKCTRNVVEAPDSVLERMISLKNTEDLGLEPPKEKESPLARNRAKLQAQAAGSP